MGEITAVSQSNTSVISEILSNLIRDGKLDPEQLSYKQRKVLVDIMDCHTEKKGMSVSFCPHCAHQEFHYGSCHNSCCPACGFVSRERWVAKQKQFVLNAHWYHLVFTVPHELNPLFLLDPENMYSFLFQAVSRTLLDFSADKRYLGGRPGFYCALHTWGQQLSLHPHIHVIFCAGALNEEGKWVTPPRDGYLFPVKALRKKFRGCLMGKAEKHFKERSFKEPQKIHEAMNRSWKKDWNVEIRESTSSPDHVIEYLGRYVNRVAITESRIVSYENGQVTFKYKDYRDHNAIKQMTLTDEEFIRRFLLHIPPRYFSTKRGYGFLSNGQRSRLLPLLKKLTRTMEPLPADSEKESEDLSALYPDSSIGKCKKCGELMEYISSWEVWNLYQKIRIQRRL